MIALKLVTFAPGYGLPTSGPFGLKLEACLRMLDIPYERVYDGNIHKGPKRKSPWIEDGELRIGDSELILEHVARATGKQLDGELSAAQRADSHILRRMVEEHFHAVFEYELFARDEGFAGLRARLAQVMPADAIDKFRAGMVNHLFERGIGRHSADEIAAMGKDDVEALATWLGDRAWFVADHPTKVDASAFGLLAVAIRSQLPTPACSHARTKPNLVAFVERARAQWFPEMAAAPAA